MRFGMKRSFWLALGISSIPFWCCQVGAASPSLRIQHPDNSSKEVEYFLERPSGNGPWPTVVLLHGHQEEAKPGGKDFVDWGVLEQLARRGYLAVAVSQPGYGQSDGPADYGGVFTQHAVAGVIAQLRATGLASPNRLLIEGISRGALTAGLIAAQDPSVTGLVLISGVYDLQAYLQGLKCKCGQKGHCGVHCCGDRRHARCVGGAFGIASCPKHQGVHADRKWREGRPHRSHPSPRVGQSNLTQRR